MPTMSDIFVDVGREVAHLDTDAKAPQTAREALEAFWASAPDLTTALRCSDEQGAYAEAIRLLGLLVRLAMLLKAATLQAPDANVLRVAVDAPEPDIAISMQASTEPALPTPRCPMCGSLATASRPEGSMPRVVCPECKRITVGESIEAAVEKWNDPHPGDTWRLLDAIVAAAKDVRDGWISNEGTVDDLINAMAAAGLIHGAGKLGNQPIIIRNADDAIRVLGEAESHLDGNEGLSPGERKRRFSRVIELAIEIRDGWGDGMAPKCRELAEAMRRAGMMPHATDEEFARLGGQLNRVTRERDNLLDDCVVAMVLLSEITDALVGDDGPEPEVAQLPSLVRALRQDCDEQRSRLKAVEPIGPNAIRIPSGGCLSVQAFDEMKDVWNACVDLVGVPGLDESNSEHIIAELRQMRVAASRCSDEFQQLSEDSAMLNEIADLLGHDETPLRAARKLIEYNKAGWGHAERRKKERDRLLSTEGASSAIINAIRRALDVEEGHDVVKAARDLVEERDDLRKIKRESNADLDDLRSEIDDEDKRESYYERIINESRKILGIPPSTELVDGVQRLVDRRGELRRDLNELRARVKRFAAAPIVSPRE